MEDLLQLREDLSHQVRCAEDMLAKADAEGRVFTEAEQEQSRKYLAEADAIKKRIKVIEDHERERAAINAQRESLKSERDRRVNPGQPNGEPQASNKPQVVIPSARYGSLQAYKGEGAAEKAYRVGMWLTARFAPPDHPMKFRADRFCKEHGVYDGIQNALSTGGSASNLVPDEMSQSIIDLREQYGIFRQWADIMPMASDHQIVPVQTGIGTAGFVGESVSLETIESDPTYSNVTLTAKKLAAMTRMSTELSEDAIVNMADRVTRDMAYAFALKEDQIGFNGTGAASDGGVVGILPKIADGTHNASFVEPSATTDLFQEITNAHLTVVMGALPQYARQGAAWFCSQLAADVVFGGLKAAGGGNTISELAIAGITALGQRGIVGSYLGYPIVTSQVLPAALTAYDNLPMLLFGNLRLAAMIGERRSISLQSTDQRYWELDQIAIKATARLDINVHSLGDNTTPGPIIAFKGSTS